MLNNLTCCAISNEHHGIGKVGLGVILDGAGREEEIRLVKALRRCAALETFIGIKRPQLLMSSQQ